MTNVLFKHNLTTLNDDKLAPSLKGNKDKNCEYPSLANSIL